MDQELAARLAAVKLVALDCDGVLTDGGLWYGPNGEAMKRFDVKDGHAMVLARLAGLPLAIVTARDSEIVRTRMRELGVWNVSTGDRDKARAFAAVLARAGLEAKDALYMGDDVNDLPPLRMAGVAACPSDAAPEVRAECALVTATPGGRGAVRELLELVLAARGAWSP